MLYERRLTEGKSDQYGRSHGFFIKVRGRTINLEDELFGLDALNHSTWSRFSMEIVADGLRHHLLSSREGVRESESIELLRKYLHGVFNVLRNRYEDWLEAEQNGIDIRYLLNSGPSAFVTEPIIESVQTVVESGRESYYFASPTLSAGQDKAEWLEQFSKSIEDGLVSQVLFERTGLYDRAVRYYPDTRKLIINEEHPFVEKLVASGRNRTPATLFGSSELLIDALLQDSGLAQAVVIDFLSNRDKVLRVVAGDEPSTAAEVIRLLKSALTHDTALERAVGMAFRVLGFEYERRGGNAGGADGVLYARLGRSTGNDELSDFKVVYDSKQTNSISVPADKISLASLEEFRIEEQAQYGFFLAVRYDGEDNPDSKLNRMIRTAAQEGKRLTILRVSDLQKLVELHYRYGVTLSQMRELFENCHSPLEVTEWLAKLEHELTTLEPRVPLQRLLETLERAKQDELETPTVTAARLMDPELKKFKPERLTASLEAVQVIAGRRWIEVDSGTRSVRLHGTAGQVVAEVERNLRDMFGVDATDRPEISGKP